MTSGLCCEICYVFNVKTQKNYECKCKFWRTVGNKQITQKITNANENSEELLATNKFWYIGANCLCTKMSVMSLWRWHLYQNVIVHRLHGLLLMLLHSFLKLLDLVLCRYILINIFHMYMFIKFFRLIPGTKAVLRLAIWLANYFK